MTREEIIKDTKDYLSSTAIKRIILGNRAFGLKMIANLDLLNNRITYIVERKNYRYGCFDCMPDAVDAYFEAEKEIENEKE
jgi:hypothetical protein